MVSHPLGTEVNIGRAGGRIERDTFFLVCTFQKTAFKNMSLVLDTVAHAKEPY